MKAKPALSNASLIFIAASLILSACQPQAGVLPPLPEAAAEGPQQGADPAGELDAQPAISAFEERPIYAPGELVDYVAQDGDTLPILAARFNTTVEEIRDANTFIPQTATTMPPGMPMKIPIYYLPFWGSPYQIIPDSLFVNGPAQAGFDTAAFLASQSGWLRGYTAYASGATRSAAEIIDLVALNYSVSPRLLLALLEYQSGAVTLPEAQGAALTYPIGYTRRDRQGLNLQLIQAANLLNNGYYAWRTPALISIERDDGRLVRIDPWQNAATVGLHYFFNTILSDDAFDRAISPDGFVQTYRLLFGDPWAQPQVHIPGSLEQPALLLPFQQGARWALTGGPHTAWGTGEPLAALDFAPPLTGSGCLPSSEWATAMADGLVVRTGAGELVLDLDGDGDERTGWVIYYLHLAFAGRAVVGDQLKAGDPIGLPSCEGGLSTGTHVHIARKYNGEWLPAEGILPFNLEGWIAHNGSQPYLGTLTRDNQVVRACTCSNAASFIQSDRR